MTTQRPNLGGLIGGSLLIGLGVLFLLDQFFHFMAWRYFGSLIGLGVSALLFVGMVAGGKSAAGLAIPGSIIGVISLISFFEALIARSNVWAYSWTLIVASVGLGLFIAGRWGDNAHQRDSGWRIMKIGLVLFIVFGAFFEVVLGFGGRGMRDIFFPVVLILIGVYLVVRRTGLWPDRPTPPAVNLTTDNPPSSEPPSA